MQINGKLLPLFKHSLKLFWIVVLQQSKWQMIMVVSMGSAARSTNDNKRDLMLKFIMCTNCNKKKTLQAYMDFK